MAIQFIGNESFPTFIGLTTDVGAGYISGSCGARGLIGKTIYITDDPAWYIITNCSASAVTIEPFYYPNYIPGEPA